MELSDKNQHVTLVRFTSLLHIPQIYGNKEWTAEWKKELHRCDATIATQTSTKRTQTGGAT